MEQIKDDDWKMNFALMMPTKPMNIRLPRYFLGIGIFRITDGKHWGIYRRNNPVIKFTAFDLGRWRIHIRGKKPQRKWTYDPNKKEQTWRF